MTFVGGMDTNTTNVSDESTVSTRVVIFSPVAGAVVGAGIGFIVGGPPGAAAGLVIGGIAAPFIVLGGYAAKAAFKGIKSLAGKFLSWWKKKDESVDTILAQQGNKGSETYNTVFYNAKINKTVLASKDASSLAVLTDEGSVPLLVAAPGYTSDVERTQPKN